MANYPYHLTITGKVSNRYQLMQQKRTESICIIGYADCPQSYYNNVYSVFDMTTALELFQGASGTVSSLQRGMLEAYYAGCQDIHLFPIGDMDEYIPFEDGRASGFYTAQDAKYTTATAILKDADSLDLLIPYDADPTRDSSITIFGQMAESYWADNQICVVIPLPTGSRTYVTSGWDSKYITLVAGEGVFERTELSGTSWVGNLACTFSGMISKLEPNVSPDNIPINTVSQLTTDYEGYEDTVESNKIVCFRKPALYKRGMSNAIVSSLTHTLADPNSDFSQMHNMNTIRKLVRSIHNLQVIGSSRNIAKDKIEKLFQDWLDKKYIRNIWASYDWTIPYELNLGLTLQISSPIEHIYIETRVGPLSG